MSNRTHRPPPKPIPVERHEFGLSKLGAPRFDLRDPYHLAVSLSWPGFFLAMLTTWLTLNLTFALLYWLRPGDVANTVAGSFSDMFFFSVETLPTVGYGVMAPATLYGHVVSTAEIVTGMAFTAIITGLLFVRFSRAKPKVIASDYCVVTMQNGRPTFMLRIVNGRMTIMSSATVRMFVLLEEQTSERAFLRRMHELHLQQSHMPLFIMPWTLMHVIEAGTPLHGHNIDMLTRMGARIFMTIEVRDHALSAMVYDIKDYAADHIRFGMRFADMITPDGAGGAVADLTRISLLQTDDGRGAEPGIQD